MPHELRLTIFGGLLPGAISLALLVTLWRRHAKRAGADGAEGNEKRRGDGPVWLLPLLGAIGFASAFRIPGGSLELWPDSVTGRYPHAVALIAIIATIEGLARVPKLLASVLRALAGAGAAWVLLEPMPVTALPTHELYGWIGVAAVLCAITGSLAEEGFRRLPRGAGPGAAGLLLAASAPLFVFAGKFAIIAQSIIGLAAVLFAAGIAGLLYKGFTLSRGGASMLAGVWVTLAIASWIHNDPAVVNIPAMTLLAIAPAGVALAVVAGARSLAIRDALGFFGVAAPLALAGWSTFVQHQPEPEQADEAELDPVELKKRELEAFDPADYYRDAYTPPADPE